MKRSPGFLGGLFSLVAVAAGIFGGGSSLLAQMVPGDAADIGVAGCYQVREDRGSETEVMRVRLTGESDPDAGLGWFVARRTVGDSTSGSWFVTHTPSNGSIVSVVWRESPMVLLFDRSESVSHGSLMRFPPAARLLADGSFSPRSEFVPPDASTMPRLESTEAVTVRRIGC